MDPTRGCFDPDCNFAHDLAELRSKKSARRQARSSLKVTPSTHGIGSRADGGRLSCVSSDALELMQQLASLLAAAQDQTVASKLAPTVAEGASLLNYLSEEEVTAAEELTGLSEILGPRDSPQQKRISLASTAAGTPQGATTRSSSFTLF